MEYEIVVRTTNECSCLSSVGKGKDNDISKEKSLWIEGLEKMSYVDVDCSDIRLKRMIENDQSVVVGDLRGNALI